MRRPFGIRTEVNVGRSAKTKTHGDTLEFATRKILDGKVEKALNFERFDDVGDELWMRVGVCNALVEEQAHGALKLGTDFLRLVADFELGNDLFRVGLKRRTGVRVCEKEENEKRIKMH